jgi:hypothetical protein
VLSGSLAADSEHSHHDLTRATRHIANIYSAGNNSVSAMTSTAAAGSPEVLDEVINSQLFTRIL